jgi:hypothetical protein
MALTIDLDGAQALLRLLSRIAQGDRPSDAELQPVLAANAFFMDFYSQWTGVTAAALVEAMYCFSQPGWEPAGPVLAALTRGFRQAAGEVELLQGKLDRLSELDTAAVAGRASAHLPPDTPLQSTIHITIDGFNGGVQHRGEIGLSLLREITDPEMFVPVVAHELHHVGFYYWAGRDPVRHAVLGEESPRAVAVRHVQNLLAEGLAVFYCSPAQMAAYRTAGASAGELSAYEARLAGFRRDERALFAQAERVLALCLEPEADLATCRKAAEDVAIDLGGIEPAGHYIGARMVEVMSKCHPHERIVQCVRSVQESLPLYNEAARNAGTFVFDPALVERFGRLWEDASPRDRAG